VGLEWFAVLRVPVLRVVVGGEELSFTLAALQDLRELAGECLRVLRYEDRCRVERYEVAHLFDYFTAREAPVSAEVRYIWLAIPGHRERARAVPVFFTVTLRDAYWPREREIKARGVLEVHSARAEVVQDPTLCNAYLCREEVTISGRRFVRALSLFSTVYDPFVDYTELER
jgi:hypothetical protein